MNSDKVLMVRVSSREVHYANDLVDGAFVLRLFGDAITFVTCRDDGDEGLLAAYEGVDFREQIHPGDFLAVHCHRVDRTRLSRTYDVVARRQGYLVSDESRESAAIAWDQVGEVVASARAKVVIPMGAAQRVRGRA
ncbi:3-aminobutyryl-CoA ammonia lyase [Nesterenkonia cremea]|uniref:3-aminobutyryl-CoA ammonia lyase n=1 Tax=Nesterenkonia cremea TaxID=1882340 RepID=A0A917AV82_9MICC|nr:3-aminobutyryl-CoA ammonia lyase [Nesterenkonia cremea]